MRQRPGVVTYAAFVIIGLLLGYQQAHRDDHPPERVVSDSTVAALTEALNNLPPRDDLTDRQQAVVDAAADVLEQIEQGEVTVTHDTTIVTTPPPTVEAEGAQGEPPPTTTTVPPTTTTLEAQPGSIDLPLQPHGTTPPTTQAP